IIPNVPNSFRNSKFIRSVEKDSFKNQNIPLYHNTFDSSSLATIGEDKFTMGAHPYGDHSSLNKIISTNKNNLGEVIRRIDASDPKASSTFENHLLKGKGLDGGESFTSFLEPSINFIPGSDLFEGTGWDGKESFISLLEPYNTWDTFRSQNHAMLSSEYEDDAVPLKQSQSIMYSDPEFDNPTARGLKSLRPSILESSRKSDSLKTVKRKSFKKQKTGLNRKIVDASSLVTNGDAQIHSFQSIKKSIQMKNPSYEKFSNSWWSNIYLPDLINSLTTRDDPTSEFQIFLDRMDMLADDLVIAYEDKYFWKDLNVNYDKLLTKSLTEKIRSDNFKKKFGEIIDQGDEPFHISLIEKFKKDISNAGSTENLTQFLPLFEAMESQGKETGFFYINSGAHSLFRTKNSRRKSADSLGKLKIPKLDSNFYQVLSNQLNEIFFEDYFENDYRILKDRALLTYIKRKWVPKNLKAYREVLRVKIQIRNLYLTITTLINKLFCDGRADLNQNFSKRQKEAIELYDLVWKSFRLATAGEFIIDISALPSLENAKNLEEIIFLLNKIVEYIRPDGSFKCDHNALRCVWKFVNLWLIYYKAKLFFETQDLNRQYGILRKFVLSLPSFLLKLYIT
ncbi:expressed protein, partial [Phakopsora pachyrhizi]